MKMVTEVSQMIDILKTSDPMTVFKIHVIPVSRDNHKTVAMTNTPTTNTFDSSSLIDGTRDCLWFRMIRLQMILFDRSREVYNSYNKRIPTPGGLLRGQAVIEWVGYFNQELNFEVGISAKNLAKPRSWFKF